MSYTRVVINVPDVDVQYAYSRGNSFGDSHVKRANIEMLRRIDSSYRKEISRWATLFQIPDGVLVAFIATESNGRMLAPNRFKATGLMQVTPNAIWECVRKYKSTTNNDLPQMAVLELNSKIPQIFTSKAAEPDTATSNRILSFLEKDSNFNIMAGTLVLRWLLERFSTIITGGQLNKAMVAYNAGAYTRSLNDGTRPNKIPIDTASLVKNRLVPNESRKYLIKMLGINGFLSLIYKDKAITV